MKILISLFLLSSLVACSGSKSKNEVKSEEAGTEMAFGDEFADDSDIFADETEAPATSEESVASDDGFAEELEPVTAQDQDTAMLMEPTSETAPLEISQGGGTGSYTVLKGETLMIVAFKIYGDYERWREIANQNRSALNSSYTLREGMVLSYIEPDQKFEWNQSGNPYLIKTGDTLGLISNTTYGTQKYWKNIWDNNKPLIKNPNRIFAGFTIYTPVIDSRDVANTEM